MASPIASRTLHIVFMIICHIQIYAVSITIRVVLGFMLLALIWKFDFPPIMVLIIAILNDGTIMTIAKDRVKPSPLLVSWKFTEIFITGVLLGGYLAARTVIFFGAAYQTDFFPIATVIAVYANWSFTAIEGIGWGWAGVIWLYNIIPYIPLDIIKFCIRYALSGKSWDLLFEQRTTFTRKKDFGKSEREVKWAHSYWSRHGLHCDRNRFNDNNQLVADAKRRAEIARISELHT